jgi:hypothetical protein
MACIQSILVLYEKADGIFGSISSQNSKLIIIDRNIFNNLQEKHLFKENK